MVSYRIKISRKRGSSTSTKSFVTMIKSIILYDCETWRLIERNKRKATKMDTIRWFMMISQRKKVRNEEIKQRMEIESSIINNIEKKQLVWYGHVQKNGRK